MELLRFGVLLPGVLLTVMKGVLMIASGHANVPWVVTLIVGAIVLELRDLLVKPFHLELPAVSSWGIRLLVIVPLVITQMEDPVRTYANAQWHISKIVGAANDERSRLSAIQDLWLAGSAQLPDLATRLAVIKRVGKLAALTAEPLSAGIAADLDRDAATLPLPAGFSKMYLGILDAYPEVEWQALLNGWIEHIGQILIEVVWLLWPYVPAEAFIKLLERSKAVVANAVTANPNLPMPQSNNRSSGGQH